LLVCAKGVATVERVKNLLSKTFAMTDLGEIRRFLGIDVTFGDTKHDMYWNQHRYILETLTRFNLQDAKPLSSPLSMDINTLEEAKGESPTDAPYRELLGCLMYISVCTRPDLSFSVSTLARYSEGATDKHWKALKGVARYLKGTLHFRLPLGGNRPSDGLKIVAYSDADYASRATERKSVTGFMIFVNGGIVYWKSQRQKNITLSTAESEYVALCACIREAESYRNLLEAAGFVITKPTLVYEDNQATIAISSGTKSMSKLRHVDVSFHYVKEKVEDQSVVLQYCPTTEMLADCLTKDLGKNKIQTLTKLMGLHGNQ
jgi:hypothetical protein